VSQTDLETTVERLESLAEYDETYLAAVGNVSESTYGFHESWDELREEVGYGA